MLVQVQISQQTFINLIILGKYRFPPKKFYNINYRPLSLSNHLLSFSFFFSIYLTVLVISVSSSVCLSAYRSIVQGLCPVITFCLFLLLFVFILYTFTSTIYL